MQNSAEHGPRPMLKGILFNQLLGAKHDMLQWIEQNRQWFLSGLGIFIAASVISFISVVLTLMARRRAERRTRRYADVLTSLTQYELPNAEDNAHLEDQSISVSYKGTSYDNLCYFSATIRNVGSVAIDSQTLHFEMPSSTTVVESFEKKSRPTLEVSNRMVAGTDQHELIYSIDRLEDNDELTVGLLINCDRVAELSCEPRGVDSIDYNYGTETGERPDVEKLILFVACFVFFGFIPFFGACVQAIVVLASANTIVRICNRIPHSKSQSQEVVASISDITVADGSSVEIMSNIQRRT